MTVYFDGYTESAETIEARKQRILADYQPPADPDKLIELLKRLNEADTADYPAILKDARREALLTQVTA